MSLLDPLSVLVDQQVYIPRLKTWFWDSLHDLYTVPAVSGRGLLMGCPLWGDEFINRFLFMCMPTIRAPKNIRALQKRGCRMVFFTDASGFERLWRMGRDLEANYPGINVEVIPFPDDILPLTNFLPEIKIGQLIDDNPDADPRFATEADVAERNADNRKRQLNKYWLLGTTQNLMIQMAARYGMGFHMLMPDHLYAEAYFPNLFRLAKEYDGIAQTSISGDIHKCLPELEKWRRPDGSLEIPDRDLGDLAWRYLHRQTQGNMMNGVDISKSELPDSHMLGWQGKDRVYLYCCHMNAAWLAPEVCRKSPVRLHNALDTELPAFMPQKIGIPEVDDGMTFIELSDDAKFHNVDRVSFPQWAMRCWQTVHWSDHFMPLFEAVNQVPIHEQATFETDEYIQQQRATLVGALKQAKEPCWKALQQAMQAEKDELAKQGIISPVVIPDEPGPTQHIVDVVAANTRIAEQMAADD